MSIQDWAALGEIVNSIAILITLIYLAVQTRQNTAAVQSSVRHTMVQEDRESLRMVIDYPTLNKRNNLTEEEETRLQAYLVHFLRARENHYLQYRNGVLDKATWVSYRNALFPVVFSSPYGRALWNSPIVRADFDRGFQESIDEWVSTLDRSDTDVMFARIVPDVD
jgi:hypothetical protein